MPRQDFHLLAQQLVSLLTPVLDPPRQQFPLRSSTFAQKAAELAANAHVLNGNHPASVHFHLVQTPANSSLVHCSITDSPGLHIQNLLQTASNAWSNDPVLRSSPPVFNCHPCISLHSFLNDECLVHFASTDPEQRQYPFSWAVHMQPQPDSRSIRLSPFAANQAYMATGPKIHASLSSTPPALLDIFFHITPREASHFHTILQTVLQHIPAEITATFAVGDAPPAPVHRSDFACNAMHSQYFPDLSIMAYVFRSNPPPAIASPDYRHKGFAIPTVNGRINWHYVGLCF